MSILEKLRLRRQERALSAEEKFKKLAADIWAGKKISEDAIESSLSDCGKTDTHLERELKRLDTIAALKAKLVDERVIRSEMKQLSLRDQQADKEWIEYVDQSRKAAEERKSRAAYLHRLLTESKKAENELAYIRQENDTEAVTEPKSSGCAV
jgi:hypothetical protein